MFDTKNLRLGPGSANRPKARQKLQKAQHSDGWLYGERFAGCAAARILFTYSPPSVPRLHCPKESSKGEKKRCPHDPNRHCCSWSLDGKKNTQFVVHRPSSCTACALRMQRLGCSPKNTCHLSSSMAKQQSPHENNETAFNLPTLNMSFFHKVQLGQTQNPCFLTPLQCFVQWQGKAHMPTLNMPFFHKVQLVQTPDP